jgi:hypothetical protein
MPAAVVALRALLEQRFPDATPITHGIAVPVASGIAEFDRALPGGGLPRGKLSICTPQGGATAIFRAAAQAVVTAGERAVWIDGEGTIAGAFWDDGPALIRPTSRTRALRCAEELARSGGFALVVLAGAESEGPERVRLVRAVHEGGGVLVALTSGASMAAVRLTSRILPQHYRWRRDPFGDPAEVRDVVVHIHARALGWNAHAEFPLSVTGHALRLSLEPELADRRGVLR